MLIEPNHDRCPPIKKAAMYTWEARPWMIYILYIHGRNYPITFGGISYPIVEFVGEFY